MNETRTPVSDRVYESSSNTEMNGVELVFATIDTSCPMADPAVELKKEQFVIHVVMESCV